MTMLRPEVSPFGFHIWERLRLTAGDEGNEGIYSCRLSDIRKNSLEISRPHYERGNSLLADNRVVKVYCTRADAVYTFSARLKETRPRSADKMYLLDIGAIRRVQRRRFVRIEKVLKFRYKVLVRPITNSLEPESEGFISSSSYNLSAGGLLIKINGQIAPDDILFLVRHDCHLKKLPPLLLAVCRYTGIRENNVPVAGIEFILNEDLPRYLKPEELKHIPPAAMQFNDRIQNELVSDIFSEQVIMRQKGLI